MGSLETTVRWFKKKQLLNYKRIIIFSPHTRIITINIHLIKQLKFSNLKPILQKPNDTRLKSRLNNTPWYLSLDYIHGMCSRANIHVHIQ